MSGGAQAQPPVATSRAPQRRPPSPRPPASVGPVAPGAQGTPMPAARLLGNQAAGEAIEGTPLAPVDLASFSAAFGVDLTDVRVHHGHRSAALARAYGARAYTAGSDVVMGTGWVPGSVEGRLLLAHELAHVVQQRPGRPGAPLAEHRLEAEADRAAHVAAAGRPVGTLAGIAAAGAVQCKRDGAGLLPEQPTRETARAVISVQWQTYLVVDDVQWHFDKLDIKRTFDLVVQGAQDRRRLLSSAQLARRCAAVLAQGIDVPWQAGGAELVDHLQKQIDDHALKDAPSFVVPVPADLVRQQFDPAAFEAYWSELTAPSAPWRWDWFALVASGGLASGAAGSGTVGKGAAAAGTPTPAWVRARHRALQQLLHAARRAAPASDLPDRVVLWHNPRDDGWYLNVWATLDPAAGHQEARAVRLDPDESDADLLARVRDAAAQALHRADDREREEHARRTAPAWAVTLERRVRARLDAARSREGRSRDLPDGLGLEPGPDVHLRIWVERGSGASAQRNTGVVPLTPAATVDQVVAYARHLAAMLREFEQHPPELSPPADTRLDDPDEIALDAFPARIVPVDLRRDNVTVTGARNEFHAEMDYNAVYGVSGSLQDLTIASKLSQQYLHFYWEVHRVPGGVATPEGETQAPTDWEQRWRWLFDRFNPPPDAQGRPVRPPALTGGPVTSTDSSDSSHRVPMPDAPGDYLVRLVTGHGTIGAAKLRRNRSEAYYPVQVHAIVAEVSAAASRRTARIGALQEEIATQEQLLATSDLAGPGRRLLTARHEADVADLARIRRKETQTLTQNTAEEIATATATLHRVERLTAALPDVSARAKEQGVAPSSLLTDPELATTYWYVVATGRTPDGYAAELRHELEQLKQVNRLAGDFANELKAGSPHQYGPETAFVSDLTGQVYPLVMMLGEAPDAVRRGLAQIRGGVDAELRGEGVAYSLVDVTDVHTKKVYHGYSARSGPEGHRAAIDDAYHQFGEDATYGPGLIATRIPPGTASAAMHPGSGIRTYASKEGIVQRALRYLGYLAVVAGVAALVATGVGAGVAAGVLGAVAATAGAITAVHNIGERQRRHTLEFDAELLLDVLSIAAVVPAVVGARAALRTAAGFRVAVVTERFLKIYGTADLAAHVVLMPVKLYQDIGRIQNDRTLNADQKRLMIARVRLGAFQSGLMTVGGFVAPRIGRMQGGGTQRESGSLDEDAPDVRNQIELLEREGFDQYTSMRERGWVDERGSWTSEAPEIVRPRGDGGGPPPAGAGGASGPRGGRRPATIYTDEGGHQPLSPLPPVERAGTRTPGTPEATAEPTPTAGAPTADSATTPPGGGAPPPPGGGAPPPAGGGSAGGSGKGPGSRWARLADRIEDLADEPRWDRLQRIDPSTEEGQAQLNRLEREVSVAEEGPAGQRRRLPTDPEERTQEERAQAAETGQEIVDEGGRLDRFELHHPVEVFVLRAIQARRVGLPARALQTPRQRPGDPPVKGPSAEGFRQIVDELFPQVDLVPLERMRHQEFHRALNDMLDQMLMPARVAARQARGNPPATFGPGSRFVEGQGAAGMRRRLDHLSEGELINILEEAYRQVEHAHPDVLSPATWQEIHAAFARVRAGL